VGANAGITALAKRRRDSMPPHPSAIVPAAVARRVAGRAGAMRGGVAE